MNSPERLRHVAVPAERLVVSKNYRKLLGTQFPPFHGFTIRAQERRSVIEVMKFAESLVA
jgi:hypothetical protein